MVDLFFYKELDKAVEADAEDKEDDEEKPVQGEKKNWDANAEGEDADNADWEQA